MHNIIYYKNMRIIILSAMLARLCVKGTLLQSTDLTWGVKDINLIQGTDDVIITQTEHLH